MIVGRDYMERKTITIEEIKSNPNLDLTERINKFANDKKWSNDDLNELALASIKQEYEYMANNMADIPHIDKILEQILNGHVFTEDEWTELMISDAKESEKIKKYNDLKKKITNNNGITLEDFHELCKIMGADSKTVELMEMGFKNKGLIIDSYKDEEVQYK